jgi:D-alanyl-D-alanine carboxypeptidase/D-alanyl-D-alanine-endopeptidase (penicillin-binding protein 4)
VAVSVRDLQTGQLLVNIEGDRLMVPASNMKVLTTGAALHVLGPDFQFRTRMVRSGDRLTVVGDGDPSFGDPTFFGRLTYTDLNGVKRTVTTAEELVDIWVNAARRDGITKVSELVVDDRIFDRQFTHPEWPEDQLDNTYCAQVAGLNFHENLVGAKLGVEAGRPAVTAWEPQAPWLSASAGKATANGKGKQTIAILRTNDPNQYLLSGNLVRAGTDAVPICVRDMPSFFARYVGSRLAAAGISVGTVRVAAAGDAAPSAEAVGPAIPMPLSEVIKRCNEESRVRGSRAAGPTARRRSPPRSTSGSARARRRRGTPAPTAAVSRATTASRRTSSPRGCARSRSTRSSRPRTSRASPRAGARAR